MITITHSTTEEELEVFKNKELQEFCNNNDVPVFPKGSTPTKAELVDAIMSFKHSLVVDNGEIDDDIGINDDSDITEHDASNYKETSNNGKVKKETRAEKRRRQYYENHKLVRVIIHTNDNSQTRHPNQLEYVTWGNRLLGHHTDRFILGSEWHIREGALKNLEAKKITQLVKDAHGNITGSRTVPAYIINRLDDLSDEELERIAKRQLVRE